MAVDNARKMVDGHAIIPSAVDMQTSLYSIEDCRPRGVTNVRTFHRNEYIFPSLSSANRLLYSNTHCNNDNMANIFNVILSYKIICFW